MADRMKKMVDGSLPDGTLIRACEGTFDYLEKQDDRIEKLEAALAEIAKINNRRDRFSSEIDAIIVNALGDKNEDA
jgi:hypothetical protein